MATSAVRFLGIAQLLVRPSETERAPSKAVNNAVYRAPDFTLLADEEWTGIRDMVTGLLRLKRPTLNCDRLEDYLCTQLTYLKDNESVVSAT
jgi:hypothetical protein